MERPRLDPQHHGRCPIPIEHRQVRPPPIPRGSASPARANASPADEPYGPRDLDHAPPLPVTPATTAVHALRWLKLPRLLTGVRPRLGIPSRPTARGGSAQRTRPS